MNITRPLIMGIASGHSAAQLRPFVVSLRRAGYAGEVCLFVDRLDEETLRLLAEQLIRINSRGVMDQGVHNFLVHRGMLKSVHLYEIDETPVMHLGLVPEGKLPVNEQGLVVNGSGRVANVIHQYGKHPIKPEPGSY
jgi:hypothetical protein